MRVSNRFTPGSARFDEDNLVSDAGLVPLLGLAEQTRLPQILSEQVSIMASRIKSGAANPAPKLLSVIAGMCAGAGSIDDVDILRAEARELARQMRTVPYGDPTDPGYRRLRYLRYADDHILGFIGPKAEAEQIKARLAAFLRETLALELNQSKTLITHARTRAARFLGYEITVQHCDTKLTNGCRSASGGVALRVPLDVIRAKCAPYRRRGKPWHRPALQNLPDYDIVRIYGSEYRGIVNYYRLAQDVWRFGALRWNAETSLLKTLAAKHDCSVSQTAARYKAKVVTEHGLRTCFEARQQRAGKPDLVARFGGIPLTRDRRAVIRDPAPAPAVIPRKELIYRLRKRRCELCEHGATVAVHQVAGLAGLGRPGPGQPAWAALMAKMRRKTLIVCADCHDHIHANPVANTA